MGTDPTKRYIVYNGTVTKIKENVWKVEQDEELFSIKRYNNLSISMKVHRIHKELESINFPHILPVCSKGNDMTIVQPWIPNEPINFKVKTDRTDSLVALNQLHHTNKEIDWNAIPYIHDYPLLLKWEDRIKRFHAIKKECEFLIGKGRVDEIVDYALKGLSIVKRNTYEWKDKTLLHGDIVHHNMLRDNKGVIQFIDFDLACTGPSGLEIALWIHRVLPEVNYDIAYLIEEQPLLKQLDSSSKALLLFPNELLREWLHFFSLTPAERTVNVSKLILFTETALSHWPKLWYDVERINI